MELSTFRNGIEARNKQIGLTITNSGLHIQRDGSYSYTVGFTGIGLSELILYDTSAEAAEEIFFTLYHASTKGYVKLAKNETITSLFDSRIKFKVCLELDKRRTLFGARTFYGDWAFDVLEVVLDDNFGGF